MIITTGKIKRYVGPRYTYLFILSLQLPGIPRCHEPLMELTVDRSPFRQAHEANPLLKENYFFIRRSPRMVIL